MNAVNPVTEPRSLTPDQAKSVPTDLTPLSHAELEAKVKNLTEELAAANAEAEIFRQQWQELRLRNEALGVEALTADQRKLEDRLVQAVKELYQSEMKRREALDLLQRLLSTAAQMVQNAPKIDPKLRAEYEIACRSTRAYLLGGDAGAIPIGTSLADGRIADINPEINAVVVNLGKNQGVKEGMSFQVYQGDRPVGRARVVLARDVISAALLSDVPSSVTLKKGDRVAINP